MPYVKYLKKWRGTQILVSQNIQKSKPRSPHFFITPVHKTRSKRSCIFQVADSPKAMTFKRDVC